MTSYSLAVPDDATHAGARRRFREEIGEGLPPRTHPPGDASHIAARAIGRRTCAASR